MSFRKTFLRKTATVGSSTLLSRALGFGRDILLARYLGAGLMSDAFLTAFRIPNSLRKMFAEGAMSAAFIPTLVAVMREHGKEAASKLIARMFLLVEGFVLVLSSLIAWKAEAVIHFIAPGFAVEQAAAAVPLLRILIFFLFFISSSALLAGALQAVQHFFIPAFGQVIINGIFIAGLLLCLWMQLPVTTFAWFVLMAGCVQFLTHLITYWYYQFSFKKSDIMARGHVREILKKFLPCLVSVSVIEINLFIDAQFASFLQPGSISLLAYASNFMRIPLGVFVVSFSTILLPHLSRVGSYAPRRLGYYLLQAMQLIIVVVMPIVFLMSFFSYDIFNTLYSGPLTPAQIYEAHTILIALLAGLLFFSLNKILLNVFYALHETFIPSLVAVAGTVINTVLNFVFMQYFQALGLAIATSLAAAIQTIIFLVVLAYRYKVALYLPRIVTFIKRAILQLAVSGLFFIMCFYLFKYSFKGIPQPWFEFFTQKIGVWLWVGPLCCLYLYGLYRTRRWWCLKCYFLD